MFGIFINKNSFLETNSKFLKTQTFEFPTNHLLYFMNFTQPKGSKDAPSFYIPMFYFVFTPLLFTFLLSECNRNNRKTTLSLKRSRYQPRTKKRSFANKTSF